MDGSEIREMGRDISKESRRSANGQYAQSAGSFYKNYGAFYLFDSWQSIHLTLSDDQVAKLFAWGTFCRDWGGRRLFSILYSFAAM